MNNWMVTGRLVKEPNTSQTRTGNVMTIVHIAVRRDYKNKNTNEYESDFYMFKAFGQTADFIHQYCKQGDLVEINGRPQNNNYEKGGEKVYSDEYIIRNISRLSAKKG